MQKHTQDAQVRQYLERQIQNATPAEQVVMLYDGALRFLFQAKKAIAEKNIQERYNNNRRACEIIIYLMSVLNSEKGGDVAFNLERLYMYMLRRLSEVDMKNTDEPIDEVMEMLKALRGSWQKIAKGDINPLAESQPQPAKAEPEHKPEATAAKKHQSNHKDMPEQRKLSVSA